MTRAIREPPLAVRGLVGNVRYEPRELLGAGGMGLVYRVYDAEMEREVALKMLHQLGAEATRQLRAEFRSVRGVLHRNLVELYELCADGEDGFFTMELLEGEALGAHLEGSATEAATADLTPTDKLDRSRGEPGRAHAPGATKELDTADSVTAGGAGGSGASLELRLERLERVVPQLVHGVSALHQAGKLHRDLKPSNVMVTREGRVVLLDFGLAATLRAAGVAGEAVGTLPYMAPEQMWGMSPSAEADWFSVGVILYEALAGRPPFTGPLARVQRDKARGNARPPREIDDAVPADMNDLVMALLDPKPARRAGKAEILRVFTGPAGPPSIERVPTDLPFVGRAGETSTLAAAFARLAGGGGGGVVRIDGVAGIGKTELVRRFVDSIDRRAGTVVLRGSCHPCESVPYKAFDPIVDALATFLKSAPQERASALVPAGVRALLRLFPVLRIVDAFDVSAANADDVEPQEIRRQGARALGDLLASVGRAYRLVVWIDDVQWGDADSALLLREVLRRDVAFLLLLSHRTEGEAGPFLAGTRAHLEALPEGMSTAITVGPLEDAHAEDLLRRLMGAGAEHTRGIVADAGGSPFLLGEVARGWAEAASPAAPEAAALPPGGVASVVRDRLTRLRERERRILEIVAISGRPLDRSLALAAAGLGESGRAEIQRLEHACVLRPIQIDRRPAVAMYHERIREAALEDLVGDARRERHRRLAEALERTSAPNPERLVEHLLGAGEEARAGRYAVAAGDQAAAALAFDQAARMYDLALRLGVGVGVARVGLRVKLAEAHADAGRGKPAAESFAAAAADLAREAPKDPRALDLRRRAAEQYLRSGHVEDGIAVLREVLAAAGIAYPATPRRALASVLWRRALLRVRGLDYRPAAAADVDPADLARMDVCWSAGLGLSWVDQIRTAAFQAEYTRLALDAGEPTRVARALGTEASQLACVGDPESAAVLARAERVARETGDAAVLAFHRVMEATIAFYGAAWSRALACCRESQEMIRRYGRGMRWEMTTGHILALASLVYLGRMRELRVTLDGLLAEAADRGDLLATASLASGLPNMAWLAADDPEEARRQADRAMALWPRTEFQAQHYFDLLARTQIDLYAGDAVEARDRVARVWPALHASVLFRVQNFRITLLHLRARTSLAAAAALAGRARGGVAARIRRDLWLRSARADARALAAEPLPWAGALALLVRASAGAMERPARTAADDLARAAAQFDALEMPLYAAAIRHRLGSMQGGAAGLTLRGQSEAWMAEQEIVAPARLAATLVPGVVA